MHLAFDSQTKSAPFFSFPSTFHLERLHLPGGDEKMQFREEENEREPIIH